MPVLRPVWRARSLARAERGYALTELLMVMAILTTVLGALTAVFVSVTTAQVDITRRFTAQHEAQVALDRIRREAHCAAAITPHATYPTEIITFSLPSGCPTGSGDISWCTDLDPSGTHWGLYRKQSSGNACRSAPSVRVANYLTSAAVFSYGFPSSSLARLKVDFTIDSEPTIASPAYRLCDEIAIRNSGRTGAGSAPTPCPS